LLIATNLLTISIDFAILLLEALARKVKYIVEAFDLLNSNAILTKQQYCALNFVNIYI